MSLFDINDFIQFKYFIALDVLPVFYIAIAILLPFVCWYWIAWMVRRYAVIFQLYKNTKHSVIISFVIWIISRINFFQNKIEKELSWGSFSVGQKMKFISLFAFVIIFSELFLRLTFEYLIAYMQMHEWLSPVK